MEYVFGCRHPDSKPYTWDRALVIVKTMHSREIAATLFEDGTSYIGHPRSYQAAVNMYLKHLDAGWQAMSIDDIEQTTGLIAAKPKPQQPGAKRWFVPGLLAAMGLLTVYVKGKVTSCYNM